MRDFEVHVLEVVNPGTANHYRFRGHQLRRTGRSRFGPSEGAQKASGATDESFYYKAARGLLRQARLSRLVRCGKTKSPTHRSLEPYHVRSRICGAYLSVN